MRLLATRTLASVAISLLLAACAGVAPGQQPTPRASSTATATSAASTSGAPTVSATAGAASGVPATAAPDPTSTPVEATAAVPGALVEAALGSLARTLHPYPDAASYTQSWTDISALIWGGADGGGALLAFDWDALDYRPAMAAEMPKLSADSKTFTFTLRDDLKWSDGSPVTSADFQYAFEQANREENRYVQFDLVQDIASLRTPETRTVELTLKDARPRDVALSIVNVVTPVPKHVWDGRSWTDPTTNVEILNPTVVLGPFKPREAVVAERGVFVPLDTYYMGKAHVPRVEILANQQPAAAYDLLRSGRANWVHPLQPAQYPDAKANPEVDVREWTAANATYRNLEFNLTRPFLSDRRVRQALAYAVNRVDLINIAEQGLAIPQYGFVQPTNQRWVNAGLQKYDFDPARARQLLEDAGYRLQTDRLVGKDNQPVRLQIVFPTSSMPRSRIAAYLQQQYRQLGIEVEVKGLEFNAYTDQVQSRREFDISLGTYGGGSLDPDLGPKPQLVSNGQQNVTGYANAQVDDLFKQAATELDTARRKQMYDQIQTLVNGDVPAHYLYALKSVDAFSTRVRGVTTHRGDRLDYNDAMLAWSVDQ